jgi:hypothetical protein
VDLAEAILVESKILQSQGVENFDIRNEDVWVKVRFAKLVFLLIDALMEDPHKKELLVAEFTKHPG